MGIKHSVLGIWCRNIPYQGKRYNIELTDSEGRSTLGEVLLEGRMQGMLLDELVRSMMGFCIVPKHTTYELRMSRKARESLGTAAEVFRAMVEYHNENVRMNYVPSSEDGGTQAVAVDHG